MGDLSGSDLRYRASQSTGKGHVVIAGSVNNDFEPWKINGPIVGTRWGPRAERTGVGGPLAVGGRSVISGIRAG
ncbi:LOW QUALITY PROTEIN: hypothetical protein YC2023_050939 [Brassica napus]